ncbi:substrate-binding periplasmic protein [Demequina capsici]|uniref:Transporter substrate-binding domain-containing protein n=1 Tax=Demequina capsici TaxID=3075620 RepID=A0AA96J6S0_9MICO|nr:transporter substrate-binding domain-containing protein [Demequina sp. OYTSA14]WNM24507.1 transporter substrate-binding domain-containing protein [Demequina sp. OYTSA14]
MTTTSKAVRGLSVVGLAAVLVGTLAACSDSSAETTDEASSGATASATSADLGLLVPGTLTVGMNLQFEPEMYLDADGNPAGYDVELLQALADELGLTLDIQNLDFNGLIPGLQSKMFDMVSVGLTNTPERDEVVDFSREYVPYTTVLAVAEDDDRTASIDTYNSADVTITALQGSSGEQLAMDTFPNATITGFADQNAALLEVATGRADGGVVEGYILGQYIAANPGQLKEAALSEPLSLGYGSWAVQDGNSGLVSALNDFICTAQGDGTMEQIYLDTFGGTSMPEMPAC